MERSGSVPESRPSTTRSRPGQRRRSSAVVGSRRRSRRSRGGVRQRLASGRSRGHARGRSCRALARGARRLRGRRGARLGARARVRHGAGGVGGDVRRRRRGHAVPRHARPRRTHEHRLVGLPDLDGVERDADAVGPVLVPDRCRARVARRARADGAGARRARERPHPGRRGRPVLRRQRVSTAGPSASASRASRCCPCVSQGAAPLGREVTITAAEGNIIHELAGRPALQTVEQIISELSPRERGLVAGGLLIGVVIDGGKPEYEQGDFLVRGVLGADSETGALVVGTQVAPGQVVRLHARDARSADEDLRQALKLRVEALAGERPAGALVFSCNGRGTAMFGISDHDAEAIERELARRAVRRVLRGRRDRPGRRAAASCTASRRRWPCSRGVHEPPGRQRPPHRCERRDRPRDRAGGRAPKRRPDPDRAPDRGARAARGRPRGSRHRLRPRAPGRTSSG